MKNKNNKKKLLQCFITQNPSKTSSRKGEHLKVKKEAESDSEIDNSDSDKDSDSMREKALLVHF